MNNDDIIALGFFIIPEIIGLVLLFLFNPNSEFNLLNLIIGILVMWFPLWVIIAIILDLKG